MVVAGSKYKTAEDLDKAIQAYFKDCEKKGTGVCREGMAEWLHYTVSELREIAWDETKKHDLEKRRVVQLAFDHISKEMQVGQIWNDNKYMAQKSMKLLEAKDLGGYNTKTTQKQDIKIAVKFGDNMDEDCFA